MLGNKDFQSFQDGIDAGVSHILRRLIPNPAAAQAASNALLMLPCALSSARHDRRALAGNLMGIVAIEVVAQLLKVIGDPNEVAHLNAVCLFQLLTHLSNEHTEPVPFHRQHERGNRRLALFHQGIAHSLLGSSFCALTSTMLPIPKLDIALTSITGNLSSYHHIQQGDYVAASCNIAAVTSVLLFGALIKILSNQTMTDSLLFATMSLLVISKLAYRRTLPQQQENAEGVVDPAAEPQDPAVIHRPEPAAANQPQAAEQQAPAPTF
jgi:hypothetical protein